MAATATDTITISIDGRDVEVPKGELLVEAVKRAGLEIPIFCYHPRLKPVGMCRMCLVEVGFKQPDGTVRKMPKPQAACTLPASDGMAVFTDTAAVHRDRKGVLEFLLINHPLDCPICDRGGECPLQNNTIFYGPGNSRYLEAKRHLPKAYPLSEFVTLDLERCIQCGRCVRFTEEISGDGQLAFRFRGAEMQPSTFELKNFDSKFSGNVIEICPVGALTSAKYRFRARPWDLETAESICTNCSLGCNIWLDHRVGKMVRINGRTNEAINEEWTCDKGKFGLEPYYNDDRRVDSAFVRHGDKLVATNWDEAAEQVLSAFQAAGSSSAGLVGHRLSNESYVQFQKMFRSGFGSNNIDSRYSRLLPDHQQSIDILSQSQEGVGNSTNLLPGKSTLQGLETKSAIMVFGSSLADELPIAFLRVRKAWFNNGSKIVVASSEKTDLDSFAEVVLRFNEGTEATLANGLWSEMVRVGKASVSDSEKSKLVSFDLKRIESECGVSGEDITRVVELLDANSALLLTRRIYDANEAQNALNALANCCRATSAEFHLLATGANEQGALNAGVAPDYVPGGTTLGTAKGLNTHDILRACAEGKIRALWLAEIDPFDTCLDRELVESALQNVEFLVVQTTCETDAMAFASVVLPMTAPAEESGTWTNAFGLVQQVDQVLRPRGSAKPGWRAYSEFLQRIGKKEPAFAASDIALPAGR